MHFGPIPAFQENEDALEVFIIDVTPDMLPDTKNEEIEIQTVKYLRSVENFSTQEELVKQIGEDVMKVRQLSNKDLG